MHERRGSRGLSKLAIPIALVVIVAVAGAYVFLVARVVPFDHHPKLFLFKRPANRSRYRDEVNQFIQDFN